MPRLTTLSAIAAGLMLAGAAAAQTFTITLSGDQLVPPADTTGTGSGYASLDAATHMLTLYVEFSGLIGPETLAHIHMAPPGVNGPIVIHLPLGSPIDGEYSLDETLETTLLAGNLYVNLHTTAFPAGELRGQIVQGAFRGACCLIAGGCTEVVPAECPPSVGAYQGDNTRCVNFCGAPMAGACCLGTMCEVLAVEECMSRGGVYQGNGAICTPGTCTPPPTCPCDWNLDSRLNSQDFFDYLVDFFAGAPGDYNSDGVTNTQDLFDFLTCFFIPSHDCR